MSLKCADLGHLAASKVVHCKWVNRLEEEVGMNQQSSTLLKDLTPRRMPLPVLCPG